MDQFFALLKEHPWIGALVLIAWAELRALPIARRQFAWLRAIGAKLQVTTQDVEKALRDSAEDIPPLNLGSLAKRLGRDQLGAGGGGEDKTS